MFQRPQGFLLVRQQSPISKSAWEMVREEFPKGESPSTGDAVNTLVKSTGKALHVLPFQVHGSRSAPVERFFLVREGEAGSKESAFRGRKLVGKEHLLADSQLRGTWIASSTGPDNAQEEAQELEPQEEFNSMMFWSHDSLATPQEDPLARVLGWASVMQSLHSSS